MELEISVYCVDLHIVDPCLFDTSIGGYLWGVKGGGVVVFILACVGETM